MVHCARGTPLHLADANGWACPALFAVLLEAGADPTLKDKLGRAALDIAKENDHAEVAKLLEQHAAQP